MEYIMEPIVEKQLQWSPSNLSSMIKGTERYCCRAGIAPTNESIIKKLET